MFLRGAPEVSERFEGGQSRHLFNPSAHLMQSNESISKADILHKAWLKATKSQVGMESFGIKAAYRLSLGI